jgi:hypothetical protein
MRQEFDSPTPHFLMSLRSTQMLSCVSLYYKGILSKTGDNCVSMCIKDTIELSFKLPIFSIIRCKTKVF